MILSILLLLGTGQMIYIIIAVVLLILLLVGILVYDHVKYDLYLKELMRNIDVEDDMSKIRKSIKEED